jgi:hypothetical protein
MVDIDTESSSPKDLDFIILKKGFEGLYPFIRNFVEIYSEITSRDMRYTQINGGALLEFKKIKVDKLKKLYENLDKAIKEFEWPGKTFIEPLNIIFEKYADLKMDIRKTNYKGAPPRFKNEVAFYWALYMKNIKSKIDWLLISNVLEWLHFRFEKSRWENLIKSKKQLKQGHTIDVDELKKYYVRT